MTIGIFQDPIKKKQFFFSYTIFIINGMLALSVGLLLPFVQESRNLSYAFAGLLVSLHSIGYLIASFTAGILPAFLGRKKSALFLNSALMIAFTLIAFVNGTVAIALAFTLTGVARGSTSNFCTTVINNLAPGIAWVINGLHAMFAIGAFTLPLLLTAITASAPQNWIYLVYFMILMGGISWLLYFLIPLEHDQVGPKAKERLNFGFLKHPIFYLVIGTLFFYLCAEQGVIGWLVTYFRNTGLLSDALAQIMSSILWLMILIGRLSTAWLSTKIAKGKLLLGMGVGLVIFFILLMISTSGLGIVIGIMGFGLSMSGVYGTAVTYAGKLIQNYTMTWSFILTFASLGSITMPSVIGNVAERAGIAAGMSSITIALILALIFIISLLLYSKRQEAITNLK